MTTTAPHQLTPLANAIIDRAIDNVNRKLIGGYRNKNNSRPNAKNVDVRATAKDSLEAVSTTSVMAVANRGVSWKEMMTKSLSRGILSLDTIEFDGEFTVKDGVANGLDQMPNTPGVYVVYDQNDQLAYIGDGKKMRTRWHAGHLNEYRQKERNNDRYKLSDQFDQGCTVKYISMDSEETAAALEAHLINTERPPVNSRKELETEQGKRENIEGKKLKDAASSTENLVKGAAVEAVKNSGWTVLEQLSAAILKAIKDELVDIFSGGKARLVDRLKRFFSKVWNVLAQILKSPLKILEGVIEFIVNALSKAFSQIYMLARNVLDLANSAWQLFKGAKTMSTEELIQKVSELIIVSGTLVIWDALEPIIEAQLVPILGPFAPYVSAAIAAMGFGLSSFYLQDVVPKIVRFLVNIKTGHAEAVEAQRAACEQVIAVSHRNFELVEILGEYMHSSRELIVDMRHYTGQLSNHREIEQFDIESLLSDN